mmetsp:Transcript_36186/g.103395  ORF Transcript_36186/g.103395 Transcript_36186/m.103395 type:complete len:233 (+) Transcript_36186:1112-1810(+)
MQSSSPDGMVVSPFIAMRQRLMTVSRASLPSWSCLWQRRLMASVQDSWRLRTMTATRTSSTRWFLSRTSEVSPGCAGCGPPSFCDSCSGFCVCLGLSSPLQSMLNAWGSCLTPWSMRSTPAFAACTPLMATCSTVPTAACTPYMVAPSAALAPPPTVASQPSSFFSRLSTIASACMCTSTLSSISSVLDLLLLTVLSSSRCSTTRCMSTPLHRRRPKPSTCSASSVSSTSMR